jgi:PAS domain S-box-containing protein
MVSMQLASVDGMATSRPGLPLVAGVAAMVAGGLTLLGWQFELPALRSMLPGWVAMNPATAVCFILAGLALWLIARGDRGPGIRYAAELCAVLVACIGAAKLAGLITGHDPGLDEMLFREKLRPGGGLPHNQMAPNTACNFLFVGLALLALRLEAVRKDWWSQVLAMVPLVFSLLALIGYTYGADTFYRVTAYIPMAVNTALAFFALSLGILFARPDRGLAAVVAGPDPGGMMARRLLPLSILTLGALGWLALRGEAAGLYGPRFAASLLASSSIVLLAVITWLSALSLRRVESERQTTAEALLQSHDDLERRVVARTSELASLNQQLEREVSEHRRTGEQMRREREFSARLIESSADGILAFDDTFRVTAWNPAMERISGYDRGEVLGRSGLEVFPFLDAIGENRQLAEVLAGKPAWTRDQPFDIPEKGRQGFFDCSYSPLRDESGRVVGGLGIIHETTDRRRLEDQFRQAQKMEAVGRLAGGVAHDFNNLLTAIMGYCQLSRRRLPAAEPGHQDLDEILKAAQRAAALTRQLLAFSRRQVLEPKVLDLNTLIMDLEKMLRRLIGEDIDLVTAPGADLASVKADPGQIEQAILNLVVNARDAMPDGGKLTIETAAVELDEEYARTRVDLHPGRYVLLAVSDTGCGMTPEVKARMFEPFFTTKAPGQGTGLGLSTVHGIVKQSDGHLEVYSEPGHGTTLKIYLPRVEADAEPVMIPRTAEGHLDGAETVLVVEDEEPIRRVIGLSLALHGYRVLEATDGSEAIAICERGDPPIDLLLTDMVMPLMSGPELAQRVARVRPDLRVLFVSGYTDRALIHQGLRQPGTAFLQKPFTPETLARTVRKVLDEPEARAA